ncbi:protein phosphatase 3 catalytic subunit alpha-like [Convolutriloba macropyga]|uniref:protein phosphatase 3 catalytic subunit alpha-like n=1 Tax=Convolutriloba macropyga TaxID=536237 RepID=UPI003F527F6A
MSVISETVKSESSSPTTVNNKSLREQASRMSRARPTSPQPKSKRIPRDKLTVADVFDSKTGLPRLDVLRNHMKSEGRLSDSCALKVLRETTALFGHEPNLLEVEAPVIICGDIHGQYYDLLKLLSIGGSASVNRYLFLGDYVDRGMFSIECVLLLYAMKLAYPRNLLMLRGNHECRHLTKVFTFKDECLAKYNDIIYKTCMESFDALPLAAIVNKQFFCVHGGLSPRIKRVSEIHKIDRFKEPNRRGDAMTDMLWSDPTKTYGNETTTEQYIFNSSRQISYFYTYNAVCEFLKDNDLICVIRGHEAQDAGYRMYKQSKHSKFPSLITIFSAPNYCETYGNKAVVLCYESGNLNLKTFLSQSHPYWLPNFQNGLVWSLPFAAKLITHLLLALCQVCTEEELSRASEIDDTLLNKVKAVSKMADYYDNVAEDNDLAIKMKGLSDNEQLRKDILTGEEKSREARVVQAGRRLSFKEAQKLDSENEQMPVSDTASTVSSLSSAGSTKSGGVKKKRKKNKNDKSYGSQKSSP